MMNILWNKVDAKNWTTEEEIWRYLKNLLKLSNSNVKNTKDICPFIMLTDYIFKDVNDIYFIMKYIEGGDLFDFCKRSNPLPENIAKFFTAQIILALEWIHANKIIYRDLKLENLLIKSDYYLLLIDFGISKILPGNELTGTFTKFTPSYCAPEIINKKKYSYSGK